MQQAFYGHDKTRGAITALEGCMVDECLLQWIQLSIGLLQSFNGGYLPAIY
jgi:hypothetical protein